VVGESTVCTYSPREAMRDEDASSATFDGWSVSSIGAANAMCARMCARGLPGRGITGKFVRSPLAYGSEG